MFSLPIQTTNGDSREGGSVCSLDFNFGGYWISVIILDDSNQSGDSKAEASNKQYRPIETLCVCL